MSQNRANEEAYISALKWIWAGVAVTVTAGSFIWLTRNDTTPRNSTRVHSSEEKLTEDDLVPVNDHEPALEPQSAQALPARAPPPANDERDVAAAAKQAEEDAQANQAIIDYEENAEQFEERRERLERELEEAGPATEQEAAFNERVRQIVSSTTQIPVNVTTRCSESVCEVSLVGQGAALGFARSASELANQLSSNSARSSMTQGEALDPEKLIAPGAPTPTEGSRSPAQERDAPAGDLDKSSPPREEKIRSISFLIDVDDLQTTDGPTASQGEQADRLAPDE